MKKKMIIATALISALSLSSIQAGVKTSVSVSEAVDLGKSVPKIVKESGKAVKEAVSLVNQINAQLVSLKASLILLKQLPNPVERTSVVLNILINQLLPLLDNLTKFAERTGKPLSLFGEKIVMPFSKETGTSMKEVGDTTKDLAKTLNALIPEIKTAVAKQLEETGKRLDEMRKAEAEKATAAKK